MFCPECGNENLDNTLFCQECGTEISASKISPESQSNYEELRENIDHEDKLKNKRSLLKTTLYIIGGLAIVFYVFIIWGNTEDPTSNSETSIINKSNCDEQESLNQAKYCTYLIYRDDDGYGSGFGIEPGFIVTNMHVVEGANKIVTFDGEEIPLTLWGYSEVDDIAVLKSDTDTDDCVWANSDQLNVAETVYAVGWPYTPEGESSVTKGIFSPIIKSEDDPIQFLQTDTAINPGNSGGPLISKCGVVGINFAKISWNDETTPLEGYGFALASNYSKPIIDKLISEGHEIKLPIKYTEQAAESSPRSNTQNNTSQEQSSLITTDLSGTFCPNPVEKINLTNVEALGGGRIRISYVALPHQASSYSIFYSKSLTNFKLLTSAGSDGSIEIGGLEINAKYYILVQFDWYEGSNHVCATSDAKPVVVK